MGKKEKRCMFCGSVTAPMVPTDDGQAWKCESEVYCLQRCAQQEQE